MTPIEYYNKKHATVSYHSDINAPVIVWKGFASTEDYKETLEEAYKIIVKHNCTQWLSDQRKAKVVPKEANEWLKTVYIPKAARTGIKKVVAVLSEDIFSQLFVKGLAQTIQAASVTIKYFEQSQYQAGYNWLLATNEEEA